MKNTTKPTHGKRVVILPGPHKTGTTSVQSFLLSQTKKEKLGNWEWPASSSKAFSDVAHSIFFDSEDKHGSLVKKRAKIHAAWKRGHDVVFGAELLDYAAAARPESLPEAFQRLMQLIPSDVTDMTAVVMYRTPRSSHLISAWKQQLAMAKRKGGGGGHVWRRLLEAPDGAKKKKTKKQPAPSLAEWLCTSWWPGRMEFYVETILAAQINPMGVAHAFHEYGNMSIVVGDMSGMSDLSNTIACEVLQVPCTTEGKIVGFTKKTSKVLNQRDAPVSIGLSDEELQEVEEVLRRMDCYYYCGTLRGNITILHANDSMFTNKEGWNDCCTVPETWLSPAQAYAQLQSLGCKASGMSPPISVAHDEPVLRKFHKPNLVDVNTTIFDGQDVVVEHPYLVLTFPFLAFCFLLRFQWRRARSK